MSIKSFSLVLIAISLSIVSCQYSKEWKTVVATTNDGKQSFSIKFPAYMDENKKMELHESAPVQYVNYFRNIYAIVDDTLGTDIYRKIADKEVVELISIVEKPQLLDTAELIINELPALMATLTGSVGVDDIVERIYYQLTVVQGKDRAYRIVIWTWDKNRDKYREEMKQIAQSFIEK